MSSIEGTASLVADVPSFIAAVMYLGGGVMVIGGAAGSGRVGIAEYGRVSCISVSLC